MKILNACVVLASSCFALLGILGTVSTPLGSSMEHPFDEIYEEGHKRQLRPAELNQAA